MKILIIDDSDYKITSLSEFASSWNPQASLLVTRSFQQGLRNLREWRPDLVLLDMTLPTSENTAGQLEGRMRFFGGRELLAEMEFEEITSQVIVVTQFDHFGEQANSVDRETLFAQLEDRFGDLFLGGVYYSNVDSKWRAELKTLLDRVKK